eukprot:TRINITY_DN703_c0_g1_i1.p1 TRINITY_DN703_c0_g1~~TRINITY_DN703_c0_g1_i1.p1  ORF type:complete len:184 (+),score=22.12 TRINITY_DN703_c0_g1_i1:60-611(+)
MAQQLRRQWRPAVIRAVVLFAGCGWMLRVVGPESRAEHAWAGASHVAGSHRRLGAGAFRRVVPRRATAGQLTSLIRTCDSQEDFKASIDGPVVVAMFSSSMCGPCFLMEPKIEELAAEYADSGVKVVKVSLNPGENAKELKPLYTEMEVRELPTFIVYKEGAVAGRTTGTRHVELQDMVKSLV